MPLAIAAVTSSNAVIVRSAYIAMNLIGLYVLVPLNLAAFVTGVVPSVGTPWGLFKHYWVVTKLALTTGATLLMLLHQFMAIEVAARRAAETPVMRAQALRPPGQSGQSSTPNQERSMNKQTQNDDCRCEVQMWECDEGGGCACSGGCKCTEKCSCARRPASSKEKT